MSRIISLSVVAAALCIAMPSVAQHNAKGPAVPHVNDQGPTASSGGTTDRTDSGTAYDQYGNIYEKYGDTTYGSDGTKAETIGDKTFIETPDGGTATCEKIEDKTFCE
jgi:hypothetical protein